MKSKRLLLLLLMALMAPWAAMAQETLTVNDGTTGNSYIPFYGLYADTQGAASECVFPSNMLAEMTGGQITAMKFYITSSAAAAWTGTHQVYVGEVDATTLTGITGPSAFTVVKTASFDATGAELTVEFDEPYTYGGGNLLIGTYVSVAGNWKSASFAGVNQTETTAWYRNGATASGSAVQFLPKTTFTYEPAQSGGDVCEKPATLVAENVTGNSATLTWTGGSGTYNVEVKGGSYSDWTSVLSNTNLLSTPLSNLTAVTDYQARVQSVCDGDTPTSGWKTVSFTTPCGAIAPGYTCGFEGPNTGGTTSYPLPACWTRPSGTSTSYPVVYNYYAHQGNYSLRFYGNTTSSSQIAVLPEIEGGVEGKRLTFYAQVSTAGSYSMSVGYMTNPDNASTFVEVESITPSASYSLYTIDFGRYTDNPSYIAIKSNMSAYYTFYVDDLALSLTPTCLPPTDLAAHNTTINSAKLSWTTHTSEQAWTVYYKTTDAANYTAQAVTTNPYTLGNLAAGTNYQYYVVANCDVDDASEPSDECYFKTNCEAETVTDAIEENFDSYTGVQSGATNNLPQCWNYINTSTYDSYNGYPVIYNYASGSHSGSNHLRLYSYYSSYNSDYDPQDQYAIMPPLEDISTLRIKLYARKNSASYDATFHVGVMTDPTDASTFVEIGTGYAPTSTTYELFTIPFDNYTGQGSFIAFKIDAANSSYSTRSVFIDDITVEPIPGCMEPSDLAVAEEEGNPTSTSVKLQWTAGGSETNWKLQYKKTSATEWTDLAETVTTNPYTLQGLDPSSTYNVRVAAWCDPTNPESVSPWSEAISFNTDCGVVSTFPWSENFNTLTAGIPNCWDNSEGTTTEASYKWNYDASGHDGACVKFNSYNNSSNKTNYLRTPELALPSDKDMQLGFWYKNSSSNNEYRVYISTDNGTTKTELTESSLNGKSSWTEMEPISLADYKGQTVVILFYGKSDYGYNNIYLDDVLVEEVPSCIKPSNLVCDSKTAHTATLSWTNGEEGQSAWQIAYSTTSNFNPDEVTPVDVTTNPATIEGLSQSTTYYAYVRANCGSEDGVSAWCNTKLTFSTPAGNVTPTGLAVAPASITSSQATASWNAVAGNTLHESYDIYWALATTTSVPAEPAAPNLISGITATSQVISGLDAETQYKVWVRDNCGTDGYSNWSSAVTFSTVSACQTPDGLAESNVTSTSATITWNTYGLTDFNLRYSTDGTTWTTVPNVNSPYTFDNTLTANTAYQVQVQATCADAETWSTVLNFRTECAPKTITETDFINEGFEDYTGTSYYTNGVVPYCWDNDADGNILPHVIGSGSYYYVHNGSKALTFYGSGNCYAYLPEFTNNLNTLQISFWARVEDTSYGTLTLGYFDSENEFKVIDTYTSKSTMTEYTTYLGLKENVPDNARLVFRWYCDNQYSCCIDDVVVKLAPSCFPVGTLAEATDIQATSAKLSWALVDDTQTAWQVCLNGDEDHLVAANTHENFLLEGLSPETAYTVKVRANCGDSQGEWSNEVNFTTLEACPAPSNITITPTQYTADITWNGDSDSYNVQYRTAATMGSPIFSEDFSNGIGDWTMADCEASTGVNNEVFRFYWSNNPPQYLISPEISGITSDAILEFVYYNNSTSFEETFKVGLSSTDNSTASFSWSETLAVKDNDQHTYHATVPAGTKYMAIQLLSDDQYYFYIDNIVIANTIPASEWTPISTTETSCQLSELTAGTKYDVQIQGVCDNVPGNWANASFTTVPIRTFTTVGNWNVASNWTPAGVPGENDDVAIAKHAIIPANYIAKVNNIDMKDGGSIFINNDGSSTTNSGQLWHNNDGVQATVNVRVYGYTTTTVNRNDYQLIASPFAGSIAIANTLIVETAYEDEFDLYKFDQSEDLEWLNYKENPKPFTELVNGQGYLYANSKSGWNNFTLDGVLRASNTDQEVPLSYKANAEFAGWNLVGNPFACNAYVLNNNDNNVPYYKMNSNGNGFEAVTNGAAIAPLNGIFVQATAEDQNIRFTRNAPSGAKGGMLNVNLSQDNHFADNAIIRFDGGSTLEKFSFRANSSKVFVSENNKDYAVVNAGHVGEIPVSFKAEKNGSYRLSFTSEEVTFSYLHLIDNMTGNDVNLLQTPSYTFDARTTDYASRFKLVFAVGSSANDETFGFVNASGNFCIFGIEGEATVQVIDVLGHMLSSETFSGSYERKINGAPGVYMVRLIQGNDVKVQKVVVR